MNIRRHRLDENHRDIRAAIESLGHTFWDCSQTNLGIDAIVIVEGRMIPVEIKHPKRLQLTEHEKKVHAWLRTHGVRVEVITCEADLQVLGRPARARREG